MIEPAVASPKSGAVKEKDDDDGDVNNGEEDDDKNIINDTNAPAMLDIPYQGTENEYVNNGSNVVALPGIHEHEDLP